MNDHKEKYLDTDWVFSMIIAMIEESIYHTETFAYSLEVHHNDKAAKVFYLICEQFKAELHIVLNNLPDADLPHIPPWEVPYAEYQHPSSVLMNANYLMSESEAWKLMDQMIDIHNDFYIFLLKKNVEGIIFNVSDHLIKYCNQCREENKRQEAKAETKHTKSLEDLDIISLHSSEGGLW